MADQRGHNDLVKIAAESPDQPGVLALLAASDRYHQALYPAESNHLVDIATLMAPNVRFHVARKAGEIVGCGAVMISHEPGHAPTGELKRMWVDPAARGLGLGRRILSALEADALDAGAAVARLETGIHQQEALGLYRACGYVERGPFGDYEADPLSVFMEKTLS